MSDKTSEIEKTLPAILKRSADKGYVQKKDVDEAIDALSALIASCEPKRARTGDCPPGVVSTSSYNQGVAHFKANLAKKGIKF